MQMKEALQGVVVTELERLGYDLVELRVAGSRSRPVFDVRIDRRDFSKVTIDDCARVSKALDARLETEAALRDVRYVLEVSSPGLDRKLSRADDWKRFVGRKANVKTAALGRRSDVEIIRVDGPEGSESVTVRDAQGADTTIPLAEILEARLAVHWP